MNPPSISGVGLDGEPGVADGLRAQDDARRLGDGLCGAERGTAAPMANDSSRSPARVAVEIG